MSRELIVGIDVGTSGTGVAFHLQGNESEVWAVTWADTDAKVPTKISYGTRGIMWGFGCETDDFKSDVKDYFKLQLGKPDVEQSDTEKVYEDFLRCLYGYLAEYFKSTVLGGRRWDNVETYFCFSVPATWSVFQVQTFERLVSKAGFGKLFSHTAEITLTEPEAVVAYQLCTQATAAIKPGETVLIVDAGGGTVDFSYNKVVSVTGGTSATEVNPVSGENIGSVFIDRGFEDLMKERLGSVKNRDAIASSMACNVFQVIKHSFGYHKSTNWPLTVPNESKSYGSLSEEDLERLFNEQIQAIQACILKMVDPQSDSSPIDHFILSGGFGSSPYLKRRLVEFLEAEGHPMFQKLTIHVSDQPQLAVCLGLVHHALQNEPFFLGRRARVSLGLGCRVSVNRTISDEWQKLKKRSKGDREYTDQFRLKWLDRCVDWLVRKGDLISNTGKIERRFHATFDPSSNSNDWVCQADIMTSSDRQPSPFKEEGNTKLASTRRIDLSRVSDDNITEKKPLDFKDLVRNWRILKRHIRVEFLVEVEIGCATTRIQFLDPKTKKQIADPDEIEELRLAPKSMGWSEVLIHK